MIEFRLRSCWSGLVSPWKPVVVMRVWFGFEAVVALEDYLGCEELWMRCDGIGSGWFELDLNCCELGGWLMTVACDFVVEEAGQVWLDQSSPVWKQNACLSRPFPPLCSWLQECTSQLISISFRNDFNSYHLISNSFRPNKSRQQSLFNSKLSRKACIIISNRKSHRHNCAPLLLIDDWLIPSAWRGTRLASVGDVFACVFALLAEKELSESRRVCFTHDFAHFFSCCEPVPKGLAEIPKTKRHLFIIVMQMCRFSAWIFNCKCMLSEAAAIACCRESIRSLWGIPVLMFFD